MTTSCPMAANTISIINNNLPEYIFIQRTQQLHTCILNCLRDICKCIFFVLYKFQLLLFIVFLSDISKLMCLITKLLKYVYLQNDLLLLHFAHLSKCQFHGFIYLGYNLGVILDSKIIVCIQPTNTFCLSYRQNTRFPDILLGSTSTTQYKSPSSHTSLLQSPMCPSFHPCHRCSFIFQPKPN